MRYRRFGFAALGLLTLAATAYVALAAPSLTGFTAKMACSAVFVSGQDASQAFATDIAPVNPFVRLVSLRVDQEAGTATTSFLGMASMRAVHRAGQGCALAGRTERGEPAARAPRPAEWPTIIDRAAQAQIEAQAQGRAGTRAIVVVQDGKIIAETYRGVSPDRPMIAWSVSKSLTSALAGRLHDQGRLDLDATISPRVWRKPEPRPTYRQLLTQTAGLPFDDSVDPLSPLVVMTFQSPDIAAAAALRFRPVDRPGARFAYSSADVNLLSAALRDAAPQAYPSLAQAFFKAANMRTAVFETDATGTYVGASFSYAAPRDWARFGQLYLDDGRVGGVQVLSPEWVRFSRAPVAASQGQYGALFWTNGAAGAKGSARKWPHAPADTFAASGQFGQMVAVIPSRRMVIVRMGLTKDWNFDRDPDALISAVLGSTRAGQIATVQPMRPERRDLSFLGLRAVRAKAVTPGIFAAPPSGRRVDHAMAIQIGPQDRQPRNKSAQLRLADRLGAGFQDRDDVGQRNISRL